MQLAGDHQLDLTLQPADRLHRQLEPLLGADDAHTADHGPGRVQPQAAQDLVSRAGLRIVAGVVSVPHHQRATCKRILLAHSLFATGPIDNQQVAPPQQGAVAPAVNPPRAFMMLNIMNRPEDFDALFPRLA